MIYLNNRLIGWSPLLLLACQLHAQTTLTWTGGAAGTNSNLHSTVSWSPSGTTPSAFPEPPNLVIASRNGSGSFPTSFVTGADYSIRSFTFDNIAGNFGSLHNIRNSTLSTNTLNRTLSFASSDVNLITTSNFITPSTIRFDSFGVVGEAGSEAAILTVQLNYSGFSTIRTGANSTVEFTDAPITGTGGIRKTGLGTLSMVEANSFSGGLEILEGTVRVSSPGALGASPTSFVADRVLINGGTLVIDGATLSSSTNRGFRIGENNGTIQVLQTATNIFGAISGPGQLTKSGGFILGLYGANIHEGGTAVQQGRVRYNNASSFGTGKISMTSSTGIYATTSGIDIANDIDVNGNIRIGDGAATTQIFSGNLNLTEGTRSIQLSSSSSFSGVISNGGLILNADSQALTLTLEGDNTYTGATTVNAGTLVINGLQASTSTTIASGATLGGTGDLVGLTTVNGTLSPGESPGTLSLENLTMGDGSELLFELTGGSGSPSSSDLVAVEGSVLLGSGVTLDLVQLGTHTEGDKFTLFSYGSLTGTFSGIAQGEEFNAGGGWWTINYEDDSPGINGGNGSGYVTITAIPESSSALAGAIGLILLLRRRKAA